MVKHFYSETVLQLDLQDNRQGCMDWMAPTTETVVLSTFLILAMSIAGTVNAAWLRHPNSKKYAVPIDRGRTFCGKRILGDNKTFRGFMIIVPFSGIAFWVLSMLRPVLPDWIGNSLWPLTNSQYALLGLLAGFAFMLGELPNSFLKRQLGIAPGEAPSACWMRIPVFIIDHVDSILALLIALSFVVHIPPATWVWATVFGAIVHLGFSAALYALDLKKRIA